MHVAISRKQLRRGSVAMGVLSELGHLSKSSATEPAMIGNHADNSEQIDYKTSRSICDAVGERLQKDLGPERSDLSPRLRELLNELRQRDDASH